MEDKKERDFASGQGYRGSRKEQKIAGSRSYYDGVRTSVKGYQEINWRLTSSLKTPRPCLYSKKGQEQGQWRQRDSSLKSLKSHTQ